MEKKDDNAKSRDYNIVSSIFSIKIVPWMMLFFRLTFFAIFQTIIALGFLIAKFENPWENSIAWWPFSVILTNFLCIIILIKDSNRKKEKFFTQFRIHKETIKKDLITMIGILIISVLLVMVPTIVLAIILFNDPQAGLKLMDYPLPLWATIISFFLLPSTQLFSEIPFYQTYIAPKLREQNVKTWISITVPSLFLSFQHITMPLILDPLVILYKMSMFILFAQFLGILIYRKPNLLPYVVIMHALLDAQLLITGLIYSP